MYSGVGTLSLRTRSLRNVGDEVDGAPPFCLRSSSLRIVLQISMHSLQM